MSLIVGRTIRMTWKSRLLLLLSRLLLRLNKSIFNHLDYVGGGERTMTIGSFVMAFGLGFLAGVLYRLAVEYYLGG